MSKKIILIVLAIFFIVIILFVYPKGLLYLQSRKVTINEESVEFYIKSPCGPEELANDLFVKGLISDKEALIAVAEYKGLTSENIALGKYIIKPSTQYKLLLNGFRLNNAGNGNTEQEVNVTFNNCKTINDLALKFSQQLLLDSARFVKLLSSTVWLDKCGLNQDEVIAIFIPNTYKIFYDTDEQMLLDRMWSEYKAFWSDDRRAKLLGKGLKSPIDAVTLASIVYSEQGRVAEEWPIIAGLYLNRLKKGIKLQSDPTFKFCWGDKLDGVQRLLNVHRDIDCPYNTYRILGLPPGPICVPPSQVVDAVLNSNEHDYIFMMAKPDYSGRHDFTVVYRDHEVLAKKYQKWLAQELKNKNDK
jgi:UPF0755 protein